MQRSNGQYRVFRTDKVTINGYSGDAMEPFITRDGNYLFFNSLNSGGDTSLYYAAKGADDVTFNGATTITGVNAMPPHLDAVASMDENDNILFHLGTELAG